MAENSTDHKSEASKWLIIISAFVYGSGFFIVYINVSRLGIIDLGPFFKLKYIHVGIIYTILLTILLIPWILFFYFLKICRENKKRNNLFGVFWGNRIIYFWNIANSLITLFIWLITFHFFAFFSIHGELRHHPYLIGFNFIPILIIFLMRNIIDLCHKLKWVDKDDLVDRAKFGLMITKIALSIMILCTVCNIYSFSDMFERFCKMVFYRYGYNFLLIVFLIGIITYKIVDVIIDSNGNSVSYRYKTISTAIGLSLLFILYIFSILTFANFFFPYIPIDKGGADYSTAPIVKIYCREKIPDTIFNRYIVTPNTPLSSLCFESTPLLLINESNDTIFVANIAEAKKSDYFRNLSFGMKIKLIGINRKNILNITYTKYIGDKLSIM